MSPGECGQEDRDVWRETGSLTDYMTGMNRCRRRVRCAAGMADADLADDVGTSTVQSGEDDEQAAKKQRAALLREQNSKAQKRYRERQLNKRAALQACARLDPSCTPSHDPPLRPAGTWIVQDGGIRRAPLAGNPQWIAGPRPAAGPAGVHGRAPTLR